MANKTGAYTRGNLQIQRVMKVQLSARGGHSAIRRDSEPFQHPPQNLPPKPPLIHTILQYPSIQSYQRENTADRACGDIAEAVDVGAEDVNVGSGIEVGVVEVVFVADDCKGGFGERG